MLNKFFHFPSRHQTKYTTSFLVIDFHSFTRVPSKNLSIHFFFSFPKNDNPSNLSWHFYLLQPSMGIFSRNDYFLNLTIELIFTSILWDKNIINTQSMITLLAKCKYTPLTQWNIKPNNIVSKMRSDHIIYSLPSLFLYYGYITKESILFPNKRFKVVFNLKCTSFISCKNDTYMHSYIFLSIIFQISI